MQNQSSLRADQSTRPQAARPQPARPQSNRPQAAGNQRLCPQDQTALVSLGLDFSTQSVTALAIDPVKATLIYQNSINYTADSRLNRFGIGVDTYLLPSDTAGEAEQPPTLFLAALEAILDDMAASGFPMETLGVINISAQQHGHVYLSADFPHLVDTLAEPKQQCPLVQLFQTAFAYPRAPIWMTSNTEQEVREMKSYLGCEKQTLELSGSNLPLRFTGPIIRRVGKEYPHAYSKTWRILLLNTFLAAVLSANPETPADYGNSCGQGLMDYRRKVWAPSLLKAAAEGLPGGAAALGRKLPPLGSACKPTGTVAAYFQKRYGIGNTCLVLPGSGDNPQTKVVSQGDLLSLGSSFVMMASTDGNTFDPRGEANAMYDGLDRPFIFGCRSNGALVWDKIRTLQGFDKNDYATAEEALRIHTPGSSLLLWQPLAESFPHSPPIDAVRAPLTALPPQGTQKSSQTEAPPESQRPLGLPADYPALVDSSLGLLYLFSRPFLSETGPLYLTGGPAHSPEICKRVSALWKREVRSLGTLGAALGAALAGLGALQQRSTPINPAEIVKTLLPVQERYLPEPGPVASYHRHGAYLDQLLTLWERVKAY